MVPDPVMDSTSGSKRTYASLQESIHAACLFDVWRCFHSDERDFTFFSAPHCTYTRIDLFLVDRNTLTRTLSSTINNITWSNHASISLSVKDSSPTNPSPVWWANSFLLQQLDVRNHVESQLKYFFLFNDLPDQDQFTLWNANKAFARATLIQMGAMARRQRQSKVINLTNKIAKLESINKHQPSLAVSKQLLQLRQDLRLLLLGDFEKTNETENDLICSR